MSDSPLEIRSMRSSEWQAVASLIHRSTNAWYAQRGLGPIFAGPESDALLFCETYEALDPDDCLVATLADQIVGSCFFRERETHCSLGIMNADPDCRGHSVARRLLEEVIRRTSKSNKPLRLVSSAFNLDSYSLYTRAGLSPRTIFQDMTLEIPSQGLKGPKLPRGATIRLVEKDDVTAVADLEFRLNGIRREKDYRFFADNKQGIWATLLYEDQSGLRGFLGSVDHPASCMLGPGCMEDDEVALALILAQLKRMHPRCPVFLVPANRLGLIEELYGLGARNCELHFAQCLGDYEEPSGVAMPSFMPETA